MIWNWLPYEITMKVPLMVIDEGSIIALMYEAAAFPEKWEQALDQLSSSVTATGSTLHVSSTDRWLGAWAGFVASPDIDAAVRHYMSSDIPTRSQATPRLLEAGRQGFVANQDLFSDEEWARDPLNTEWAEKWGLGPACAATAMRSPSGEIMVLHVQRGKNIEAFTQREILVLDSFRPHIARAALLASRWRLRQLCAISEALSILGLPAAIVDRQSRCLAANSLFEENAGYVDWRAKDRIALLDQKADRLLRQGLAGLDGLVNGAVYSFPARANATDTPAVVHLIPTAGQSRDLFEGGLGILIITPVISRNGPDSVLIQGLFDLTPNEARVAARLSEGLAVSDIASRYGVGRETIRSQIKAVLSKLGVRSQLEATSLLRSLPQFPISGSPT